MPILHIINHPPSEWGMPEQTLSLISAGDGLMMIENGVYGALQGVLRIEQYPVLFGVSRFVLVSDLEERGLIPEQCDSSFEVIDYAGFVDLVTRFDTSISWG